MVPDSKTILGTNIKDSDTREIRLCVLDKTGSKQ